jgi:hypothetical protein
MHEAFLRTSLLIAALPFYVFAPAGHFVRQSRYRYRWPCSYSEREIYNIKDKLQLHKKDMNMRSLCYVYSAVNSYFTVRSQQRLYGIPQNMNRIPEKLRNIGRKGRNHNQ